MQVIRSNYVITVLFINSFDQLTIVSSLNPRLSFGFRLHLGREKNRADLSPPSPSDVARNNPWWRRQHRMQSHILTMHGRCPDVATISPWWIWTCFFFRKKCGFKSYMKNKHRGFVIHGGTPFIHSIHFNRIFPGFSHPADLGMPWFEWPLVA